MARVARRWTEKEEKALLDGVGAFGWSALRKRTSKSGVVDPAKEDDPKLRTKAAIQEKIRRTFNGGGITRGSYTVNQAERETGYDRTQLKRAAKALSQRWSRTAKGGNYLISAEQIEDIVAWLAHDYWSIRLELYCCEGCGTDTQEHYRFGLCRRCFTRLYYYARTRLQLPFSKSGLLALLGQKREGAKETHFLDLMIARVEAGKAPLKEDLQRIAKLE